MPAMTNTNTSPNKGGVPSGEERSWLKRYRWAIVGLVIAAAMVVILAPAASEDPDGLDRVSQDKEFDHKAEDPAYEILPDYSIPGVDNEWVTVVLSGLIGVAICFAIILVLGFLLQMSRRNTASTRAP